MLHRSDGSYCNSCACGLQRPCPGHAAYASTALHVCCGHIFMADTRLTVACASLCVCRKTSWRCFLAAVCATFTLQTLSKNAAHGMISFTGVHNYENRDWLMQLPFILINAGVCCQNVPCQLCMTCRQLSMNCCLSGHQQLG
jgi:hypothetical protein